MTNVIREGEEGGMVRILATVLRTEETADYRDF